MRFKEINESFDAPLQWHWASYGRALQRAEFEVGDGDDAIEYKVRFQGDDDDVHVSFDAMIDGKSSMGMTGTGSANRVLATVIDIVQSFLEDRQPKGFHFTAFADEGSRVSLYKRMARTLHAPGYDLEVTHDMKSQTIFLYTKTGRSTVPSQ
jgi:hypothetical protein